METYPYLRQETWKERLSKKIVQTIPIVWRWLVVHLLSLIQITIRFILSLIPEALGRS